MNKNNTIYAANCQNGLIRIWLGGSASPTGTIATGSTYSYSLFVTVKGDTYISNMAYSRIDVWRENTNGSASTLYLGGECVSVFVDTNDSLYCSLQNNHQVIKRSLNSSNSQLITVAGADCLGYLPNMLYSPRGIFVAINFDLYVADAGNNRIQRFHPSQVNGTTVAGSGAPGTILLYNPAAVTLDADGYLFITDIYSCRIIGSGPHGYRCVVGCTNQCGSESNQLYHPQSMAFDSYGNIFVVDSNNHRVQKFLLSYNSCSK